MAPAAAFATVGVIRAERCRGNTMPVVPAVLPPAPSQAERSTVQTGECTAEVDEEKVLSIA